MDRHPLDARVPSGGNLDVRDRFVNYLLTFAVETASKARRFMSCGRFLRVRSGMHE